MSDDAKLSAEDFGASFRGFMKQMASQAPVDEPFFAGKLRAHFGADPAGLPTVAEDFDRPDHPNLHNAIETYLAAAGRSAERFGVVAEHAYQGVTLSQLASPSTSGYGSHEPREGPVEYVNVALGDGAALACLQNGLLLVSD